LRRASRGNRPPRRRAGDARRDRRLRREDEDRHRDALGTHALAPLETVAVREAEVEHRDIEVVLRQSLVGLCAARRAEDDVSVAFERPNDELRDVALIFDDEDAHEATRT